MIAHLSRGDAANKLVPANIIIRLNTLCAEAETATGNNNPAAALAVLYRKVALDSHIKLQQQVCDSMNSHMADINTALEAFVEAYTTMQTTIPVVNDAQMPIFHHDLNAQYDVLIARNAELVALYNTDFMGYTSITPPTPESSPKGLSVVGGIPASGWNTTQLPYCVGGARNAIGQKQYTLSLLEEGYYNPFSDRLAFPENLSARAQPEPASSEGSHQGSLDALFE